MNFPGDLLASQVKNLREEITAILSSKLDNDQVVLLLTSGGGTVSGYGLASTQLKRLKDIQKA